VIEHRHKRCRIVHVWHPAPRGELWYGTYGNAPVSIGAPAFMWNTGETIAL
jgi:hypothetical protein